MIDMKILETPVHHGSDFIHCFEATGFSDNDHRLLVKDDWQLRFDEPPKDLRIIQKKHQLAFFRARPEGMQVVIEGRATASEMQPPVQPGYTLTGMITSNSRRFNPRRFSITAGGSTGHLLALYRSPLGTQIPAGGAVIGNLEYESGVPAAWAIVTVTVTPTVGSPLIFTAQADQHGDFIVPLNRVPALDKDAPAPNYSALLRVKVSGQENGSISDPDSFY